MIGSFSDYPPELQEALKKQAAEAKDSQPVREPGGRVMFTRAEPGGDLSPIEEQEKQVRDAALAKETPVSDGRFEKTLAGSANSRLTEEQAEDIRKKIAGMETSADSARTAIVNRQSAPKPKKSGFWDLVRGLFGRNK